MARKKNSLSKSLVWIILALLFVGLAGFGATNLSGSIRTVGSVGDKEITVDEYVRAMRQEMQALQAQTGQPITMQQAQSIGLDRQVLSQLITTHALDYEAERMGLSIGDTNLLQELSQIQAFQGPDGNFDREAYRFALQNAGLEEAQFEAQLRDEVARSILQGAILAGNAMPEAYLETMMDYVGARRSFTWARLGADALQEPLPEPDEETLRAFYEENIGQFTRPETRQITYAWLTPEMLIDTIDIEEDVVREQYDARADQYDQPERRLVERLVFSDDDAANDAMAQLEVDGTTFETLVEDRGLALSDVDMGDVSREELGAAGEAVFSAEVDDVVGPFQSSLGPALYRVNGVLKAQTVPFEEARPELEDELAHTRARQIIQSQAEDIADLLAGGATLEELADETEMELGEIGFNSTSQGGIAAYEEFREAAASLTTDDYPEVDELSDGGLYAMRLDEIVAPEPYPFEEVADQVRSAWETAETRERLTERAEALKSEIEESGDFAAAGLDPQTAEGLTRQAFIEEVEGPLLERVFEMEKGQIVVVPEGEGVILVRLDDTLPPDEDNPDMAELRNRLRDQAGNSISQDLFQAFANDIRNRAGIQLDQQALNAVHSQFQ
ncbi:peptidylprolyl isomerase [Aquicoccus sp. SCR17]|nr:peptidylprolyl isomerase [Carideicomes alvinocaridis]